MMEIDEIEAELKRLGELVRTWNSKLASINMNMRNYLKVRLPKRAKIAATKQYDLLKRLEKLYDGLKNVQATTISRKYERGERRVLLRLTVAEMNKLRTFLRTDRRKEKLWTGSKPHGQPSSSSSEPTSTVR